MIACWILRFIFDWNIIDCLCVFLGIAGYQIERYLCLLKSVYFVSAFQLMTCFVYPAIGPKKREVNPTCITRFS